MTSAVGRRSRKLETRFSRPETVETAAETEAFLATRSLVRGTPRSTPTPGSLRRVSSLRSVPHPRRRRASSASRPASRCSPDRTSEALATAREAFALAETLSLDELRAHALTTIGSSKNRVELGSGYADLRERARDRTRRQLPAGGHHLEQPRRRGGLGGRLPPRGRPLRGMPGDRRAVRRPGHAPLHPC